jgi:hypothetical protein
VIVEVDGKGVDGSRENEALDEHAVVAAAEQDGERFESIGRRGFGPREDGERAGHEREGPAGVGAD